MRKLLLIASISAASIGIAGTLCENAKTNLERHRADLQNLALKETLNNSDKKLKDLKTSIPMRIKLLEHFIEKKMEGSCEKFNEVLNQDLETLLNNK